MKTFRRYNLKNRGYHVARVICGLFVVAFLLAGCTSDTSKESSVEPVAVSRPDQVMHGAEIFLMKDGRRAGIVRSDTLVSYTRKDTTLLYGVEVDFFDSVGAKTSTLTADSGRVTRNNSIMEVMGHVRGLTVDNKRLETDSLRWNSDDDKVETDGFVVIHRGDDRISGWGMETDARLEKVVIKRDSKGAFTQPANGNK